MHLYAAVCASLFGRGSRRPYRAAVARLAIAWSAAAGIGILISRGVADIPASDSPQPHMAYATAIAAEAVVLLPLLAAAGMTRGDTGNLNRLLLTLPLKRIDRSTALLVPGLAVTLLSISLAAYPLSVIALRLGIPWPLLPGSLAAGTLAAFGLAYGMPAPYQRIRALPILLVLWGQYKVSGVVGTLGLSAAVRDWAAISLLLLILLPVLLSARSGKELATGLSRTNHFRDIAITHPSIPTSWFVQKIRRDAAMKTGLATTLLLSLVISLVSWRQNVVPYDAFGALAAILAAAFCSDVRALSRRYSPPEIAGLKGTWYFMTRYLVITGCFGLAAVSPLLVSLAEFAPWLLPAGLSQVGVGIGAGIFSGTLLAAGRRDVLAQSAASLLSLSVLLLPAQVPLLAGLAASSMHAFQGVLVAMLLIGSLAIEYKRNTFTWRISHVS